jgi:uncharacterized protein (DUF1800 family)
MISLNSRFLQKILLITAITVCSTTPLLAGSFNSPSPTLVPGVVPADPAKSGNRSFIPGSTVKLSVDGIASQLLKNEGGSAFRLYVADERGRIYRFGGTTLQKDTRLKNGVTLTFNLIDEVGYWPVPATFDGMKMWVTWRGMASNINKFELARPGDAKVVIGRPSGVKGNLDDEIAGPIVSPDRNRFIQQATFGYTLALDNNIRIKGLNGYLNEQFAMTAPTYAMPLDATTYALRPTAPTKDCNGTPPDLTSEPPDPVDLPNCYRDTYTQYPLQQWFFKEALYSNSQLRNKVAWALSQVWVSSGVEIKQSRHMAEYYKVLYDNAFGNYRTLMRKMTLNPAMGEYLDMSVSTAAAPNENYPRELMQLFTLGLIKLNLDGTPECVPNQTPCQQIPTYSQDNVVELARVFTGWSFCNDPGTGCPKARLGAINFADEMKVFPSLHDHGKKMLLDYNGTAMVPGCSEPCTDPNYQSNSLDYALDNIYGHQNVAPFVSKLLIQHLVRSDPTPAYVGRVAAVFNANKTSSTQMQEVIRAIIMDVEARGDLKTDAAYGKLREPVQYTTNMLRALSVKGYGSNPASDGVISPNDKFAKMSQVPFMSPSVFNYYSPTNVIVVATSNPELPDYLAAPEFMLMTPPTAVARANFSKMMILDGGIPSNSGDIEFGTSLDLTTYESADAADSNHTALIDLINQRLLHGSMSNDLKNAILPALPGAPNHMAAAKEALYLVVTSSQFQVQR